MFLTSGFRLVPEYKMMEKIISTNCLRITARALPESFDEKANSIDVVWGNQSSMVKRFSWDIGMYIEQLSFDPAHVDMKRLSSGAASFLKDHDAAIDSVIGVIESASIKGGQGFATIRLSEKESSKEIIQDMKAGILKNISVGYFPRKMELLEKKDGELPIYLVTDWEPAEISLVAVPADPEARTRNQEKHSGHECVVIEKRNESLEGEGRKQMPEITNNDNKDQAIDLNKVREEAAQGERTRCSEISRLTKTAGLDESFGQDLIKKGTSLEVAQGLILDAWAKRGEQKPAQPKVERTEHDETDIFRKKMSEAIAHRANPDKNKLTDLGRNFGGYTLRELARICVERQGVKTGGMGPMEIVTKSLHGTSDFPYVLENVMQKSLRSAYEENAKTFQPWCKQASASDFKPISRTQLGNFPSLQKVNEHGEFNFYSIDEGKETYQLATYGAVVGLTRQAIINDDLSAFDRIPQGAGAAAAGLESDIVYGILTANGNLSDAVALFATSATRKNLAASAAAISVASLGIGKAAMRVQKGLGSNAQRPLNLTPSYLIVPAALETIAQQFTSQAYVASQSGSINPFASALQVIVEPRLDAASATAWYLAAKPQMVDTIEYCYLEGSQGVYTETQMGFEVDGVKIKVRHDFAAKAIDFRGLFKNAGA